MCLCATTVALAVENTVVPMVVNCNLEEISTAECNIHVQGAIADADVSTIRAYIVSHGYTTVDVTTIPATNRYKLTSTDIVKLFGNYQGDTSCMIPQTTTALSMKDADITSGVSYGDYGIAHLANLTTLTCSKTAAGPYFSWGNSNIEKVIVPKIGKDGASGATIGYFHGMTHLKEVDISTCAVGNVPASCFEGDINLSNVTIHSTNMTVIGASAFSGCTALKNIIIPDGVTTLEDGAFGASGLTHIALPNSLTSIGSNCFLQTHLVYAVIPPNVTSFGANAYNGIAELKDVYLMGENIKSAVETFTNYLSCSSYIYSGDLDGSGTVTAADWKQTGGNAHAFPVTLHFPNTTAAKSHYVNPFTKVINDKTQLTALETIYKNYYVNHTLDYSGFAAARDGWFTTNASTYGSWLAVNSAYYWTFTNYYNALYNNGTPTPLWVEDSKGYRYPYQTENLYTNYNSFFPSDEYGGWNQFMLVVDNVDDMTWNETRILDRRWYSMVMPFDMTRAKVEEVFGAQTEVCDFALVSKVTNTKTIFYFNNNLVASGTVYVQAHHPYMIYPGTAQTLTYREGDTGHTAPIGRLIYGVDRAAAKASEAGAAMISVTVNYVDSTNAANNVSDAFYFTGNYDGTKIIPQGTYYWGYKDAATNGFYHMAADGSNWATKPYWTSYTALVKSNGNAPALAKVNNMVARGFDEDNNTTLIKFISNDETRQKALNNRVTNLNGQVVSDGSASMDGLEKGIYIVN